MLYKDINLTKSDKRYTTRELMDMDLTICADFFAIPKDDRNFSERIFNILKYNNLIDDTREDVNDINEDGTDTVKKSFGNIKCEDLNILRGLTFNINHFYLLIQLFFLQNYPKSIFPKELYNLF